jgi:putative MATE family efflux protein
VSTPLRPRLTPLDLSDERLTRTIIRLTLPVLAENLLITAVFFADTLIVGWLRNEVALAGAMLGSVVMWISTTPFQALGVATASLVARRWGAHRVDDAKQLAAQAVSIALAMSLAMTLLIWPFAFHLLRWMGAEPAVVELGGQYMRVVLLTAPLGLPMIVANAAIRGTGDTRTPMLVTLTMNVVNIAASAVLAFGLLGFPRMGLLGVATGTAIARAVGGLLVTAVVISGKHDLHLPLSRLFTWHRSLRREVLTLATPAMADRLLNSGAHIVMMAIIALLGTTAIAAHNIGINVESLCFMAANGIGAAVTTLCGQAIGAGRPETAERIARRAGFGAAGIMLALGILFIIGAPWGVRMFGATPETLRLAGIALQISALELPPLALTMVYSSALHAAGDTKSPLKINIVCILLFRFGLVYLLAITFGLGLAGVWLGTAGFWMVRSTGLWLVWRSGRWRTIEATT